MMMHVRPPRVGWDPSKIPANDDALIRLCRATLEALNADKAACDAACDVREVFEDRQPSYPTLEWRYSHSNLGICDLREALRKHGPNASATWKKKMRMQIAAVRLWHEAVDDVRRSTGLAAAEQLEARTGRRARALMAKVIATPARTVQGLAHKAAIMPYWIDAGYGLNDEGEDLALSILDELRLLAFGGNMNGLVRVPGGLKSVALS